MTFSIVARCEDTGMFGMAISSSSPAVAARCVHIRAGCGAVASQNVTDPHLGTLILEQLETGASASAALNNVVSNSAFTDYRQLLVVDANGATAIHTGDKSLGIVAQASGSNAAAAGNLLHNKVVPEAMLDTFIESRGHLANRLLAALVAGLGAGGEAGAVHSAGLQVMADTSWPIVDLRCDWSDTCPIDNLQQTWNVYEPQMADYIQRALDPTEAPSYGVPGDND